MHQFNSKMHSHSGPPKDIVSYEIALKSKKLIANETYAFIFEKPRGFQFKAGQHARLTLIDSPESDEEGISRFLSFASSPQETDLMFVMRMRNTAFKRILGSMKRGDKILMQMRVDNPHGSFAILDSADARRPAVFLIGGIGIVPAYSMIKDAIENKLPHKIFLFYTNRRPEDTPFLKELEKMEKQNPSFKLIATMTKSEKLAKFWKGETGYIDLIMLAKYVYDYRSPIYYIAGLPKMVKAMKTLLLNAGIKSDSIRAEEFDGFTMNHKDKVQQPMWKSHVPVIVIASVLIVVVLFHVVAGFSIYKSGFGALSLNNPITYFILGLSIIIATFKLKHVFRFIFKKQRA